VDIVDRLVELVAIPSVSGHEAAITGVIEDLCHRSRPDWPLRRLGNNLVLGPLSGGGGSSAPRPLIGLIGHTDTVPPQGNESPEVRDDRIFGVGACDMKGGVAVMCDLIEHLPTGSLPLDFVFVFYDKEEVGFDENGLGRVLDEVKELQAIDLAFVHEPTSLALELGCNGNLHAQVVFKGTSAHSARTWLGENAIQKAGPFISKIGAIQPRDVKIGDAGYREVIGITLAQGGIARNVVPDSFTLQVNHRFPPDLTIEDSKAYVQSLVPPDAEIRFADFAPPGAVPENNAVLDRFRTLFDPAIRGKQGWTDVARFTLQGIDAVNFGPGDPHLCHRRDEHIAIGDLERCRDMMREFITGY